MKRLKILCKHCNEEFGSLVDVQFHLCEKKNDSWKRNPRYRRRCNSPKIISFDIPLHPGTVRHINLIKKLKKIKKL